MCVFHIFKIVRMVPNCAKHRIYFQDPQEKHKFHGFIKFKGIMNKSEPHHWCHCGIFNTNLTA